MTEEILGYGYKNCLFRMYTWWTQYLVWFKCTWCI